MKTSSINNPQDLDKQFRLQESVFKDLLTKRDNICSKILDVKKKQLTDFYTLNATFYVSYFTEEL